MPTSNALTLGAIRLTEPIKMVISYAVILTVYVLFDQVMSLPWPHTVIGDFWPVLRMIPSV